MIDSRTLGRRLAELALTDPIVHAELHRLMRDEERSLEDAMLAMIESLVECVRRLRREAAGALATGRPPLETLDASFPPELVSLRLVPEPPPPSSGRNTPPPSSGPICVICGVALKHGRYCSATCYRADEGYGDREEPDVEYDDA